MRSLPPPIPVYAKGPLGVVQLPRLWAKVRLHAAGLLREGYYPVSEGFDKILLEGLGLDREEVVRYLKEEKPSYFAFEQWVAARLGPDREERIRQVNETILGREMPEERRTTFLERLGLPAETPARTFAELNAYDDWAEFHAFLAEYEGEHQGQREGG